MRHSRNQLMKTNQQASPAAPGGASSCVLVITLLLFLITARGARSQVLESFLQTGGAFQGTGGIYEIVAAIEALDPGDSTATGDYALLPGIWSIQEAPPAGEPPNLAITLQDAEATIFWPLVPEDLVLQRTSNLADPSSWTDVSAPYLNDGELEFITISIMESRAQFFRLRTP